MIKFRLFLVLFAAAYAVSPISGQAGRPITVTEGKKNQRQAASPTPTPVEIPIVENTTNIRSVEPGIDNQVDDGDVIKVTTQIVSVPVRVMDKKGRFVAGLPREKFKVFENGKEQEIALFSNEHEPFTVALVLDMSYSTTFKINEIQNAAIAFIDQLRPQDKVMVVSFSEEVLVLCQPTNDRKEIYEAIQSTKIATGTSLYEAMDLVMNERMQKIPGRKAVILFSDGVDTTSRRAHSMGNISDAMELDALIYTIKYDTFYDVQKMKNGTGLPQPPVQIPGQGGGSPFPSILTTIGTPGAQGTTPEEYQKAAEYLDQLSSRTGGRLYEASTLSNLSAAYSKIASELREFYSVSYYPAEERTAGKRKSVKVKVDEPGLVVKAREGYSRRTSKD